MGQICCGISDRTESYAGPRDVLIVAPDMCAQSEYPFLFPQEQFVTTRSHPGNEGFIKYCPNQHIFVVFLFYLVVCQFSGSFLTPNGGPLLRYSCFNFAGHHAYISQVTRACD